MTRIPLAEADTYGAALRRTRRLRLGLAAALALVAAAALAAAWALRPVKPSLLPPGTSGVIVLDVSSSIGVRTHKQIAHTLANAARTRDRYGLVIFSESAYEALPPGTPSAELRRYERLFRPVGELETDPGPDGLVPLGDPEGETLSGGAGGARFPASPWRGDFSGGTRISEGLRLARRILERDRISDGSVLLVSDLDDDQADLPSLTQALLEYRIEGTPIRVVGLAPDARNRTLFARLLGLPTHEHAMAHYSYPSPNGEWLLIVEMDGDHAWMPCRLMPLNGNSPARKVGPAGAACTSGAWSPDGKWMYVTSNAGGVNRIWRQQFPDGEPEQVTSGPTAEEGITFASDGRSFVTAAVLQNVSIWLHDSRGERQISSLEGIAVDPKFTHDGKKLCYVVVKETPTPFAPQPGEVWVADLESGRSQSLVPGFQARNYDVSTDSQQVVMDAADPEGKRGLWLAPLDRQSPPRRVPNADGGRDPKFAPDGEILFRRGEGTTNFAYRIRPDGSRLRKALEQEVALLLGVSRDGRWIVAWSFLPEHAGMALQGFPIDGGPPVTIAAAAQINWSPDGDSVSMSSGPIPDNRSYIVPLARGEALPRIPAEGFRSEEEIAQLPGARRIDAVTVPGPSPDVYAFYRGTTQRNLYRVPVQ